MKYVVGIWHMLEDLIFIINIKLVILFAGETDIQRS